MPDSEQKSALLVPVPEVEMTVGLWRDQLDPAAARGMPAHVTVLFPFAPPASIDESMIKLIEEVVTPCDEFAFSFNSTEWFDDRVVYLAPIPDTRFRQLSQGLQSAFPEYRPYGGKYEDPLPHLTIGDGAPLDRLRFAASEIQAHLPITITATEVWLMTGGAGLNSWALKRRFQLHIPDGE